jgi:hypothetical protein
MQEPERPLGLGILAVASFAAALWNIYALITLYLGITGRLRQPEMARAYQAIPESLRWFLVCMAVAKAAFLIVAGAGYFGRRRFGRLAGSAYAVLSIVESAIVMVVVGDVSRDSVIAVLFAAYTLVAVNTMYREALTR